jgi:hypothetical protein
MLTIFSLCEGVSDGPQTGTHDQQQQDHEQIHRVKEHNDSVCHRGDAPIFLKDHPAHASEGVPVCCTSSWVVR